MSANIFFTFFAVLIGAIILKLRRRKLIGCLIVVSVLILVDIEYTHFYDIETYKENIVLGSQGRFEFGWEVLTAGILKIVGDANVVITIIITMNFLLVIGVLSTLDFKSIGHYAFMIFILSKWFLYLTVVIRFGLASLLFIYLCVSVDTSKNIPLKFIVGSIAAISIHFSILPAIVFHLFFAIRDRKSKIALFLVFIACVFFYDSILEFDGRLNRYMVIENVDKSYNLWHILIMGGYFVTLLINYLKMAKSNDNLVLLGLVVCNMILQPYDSVNRIVFCLMIIYLYRIMKNQLITKSLEYYTFFISSIFIVRSSLLAADGQSLLR